MLAFDCVGVQSEETPSDAFHLPFVFLLSFDLLCLEFVTLALSLLLSLQAHVLKLPVDVLFKDLVHAHLMLMED